MFLTGHKWQFVLMRRMLNKGGYDDGKGVIKHWECLFWCLLWYVANLNRVSGVFGCGIGWFSIRRPIIWGLTIRETLQIQ